jgi:glutamate synthase (NADPH/NADH) small chain|tara:strand:- start:3288 stop:4736 length:1449 start_codon:yes stop_codon:yes gene_type:complete
MGKNTGFLEFERQDRIYESIDFRRETWKEFIKPLPEPELERQAARCMDCGIPFCHNGCPVNNLIPDFNDLVYRDQWKIALQSLHSTNNFPEFTGRICPAPCESACTLNIDDSPVTIKTIECAIVDRGWQEGWIKPQISEERTGKRVGVIGSGPAGMACAQQLSRAGHDVTLFEKNDRIGGLMRYGIPDFKMEKWLIDRRVNQMKNEGVVFSTNTEVGVDVTIEELREKFDALVMSGGAETPRDLEIQGREFKGIHFAMDFLLQQNKRGAGDSEVLAAPKGTISAKGKNVIVIGGGDTGSDCIGTSVRHGASSITQLEIMPKPPIKENKAMTWPNWPLKLRTSSSQEEGCERDWSVVTKRALGSNGKIESLECVRVEWDYTNEKPQMKEIKGSKFQLKTDLVLLAMGFIGPRTNGMLEQSGVDLDSRGNVAADTNKYQSSLDGVFAAGDMRRGQSLVVWAIREGRQCAHAVDAYLMGSSTLPK